ncbi:MAG: hypothetical protein WCJ19_02255 [bacterium]
MTFIRQLRIEYKETFSRLIMNILSKNRLVNESLSAIGYAEQQDTFWKSLIPDAINHDNNVGYIITASNFRIFLVSLDYQYEPIECNIYIFNQVQLKQYKKGFFHDKFVIILPNNKSDIYIFPKRIKWSEPDKIASYLNKA